MKNWLLSLAVLLALLFPTYGQAESWQDSFNQQIKQWSIELSMKDSRFSSFKDATFSTQALGPGSHQWLVEIKHEDKPIGYMIVGQSDKEFYLLEYGLGENYLFDESMLPASLNQNEKSLPLYSGLESLWVSSTGVYDAKSGEKYPAITGHEYERVVSTIGKESVLQTSLHKQVEGSYGWIKPQKEVTEEADFLKDIKNQSMFLVADLFDSTVKAPFEVTGYHLWSGEVFVELNDNGSRFLPFSYAVSVGKLGE